MIRFLVIHLRKIAYLILQKNELTQVLQGPDYQGLDPQHFEGHLDLTLRIIESTDTIIMNALYLEISSVLLFDSDGTEAWDRKKNFLII